MCEEYHHLLIAQPADFIPTADQIGDFFVAIEALGFCPQESTLSFVRTADRRYETV